MGLLALSFDERFAAEAIASQQPPTFDAYREFNQGVEHYLRNEYRAAIPRLYRAFELDSTFAIALLYAAFSHSNLGEPALTDSLAEVVATFRDDLSDYRRHWLDYLQAQLDGDRERALRAIRQAKEIAPGSKAAYNVGYVCQLTNRPQEAIDALATLDPERGPMRGWYPYWLVLTDALHRLGEHKRELSAARRARQLYPDRSEALQLEANALIGLGRLDEIDGLLEEAAALTGGRSAEPISAEAGQATPGSLMLAIARELRAHDYPDAAQEMYAQAVSWHENRPADEQATRESREALASALRGAGRAQDYYRIVEELAAEFPTDPILRASLGRVAATRGDRDEALEISGWLETVDLPYARGSLHFERARIAAALGDAQEAVELLRTAVAEGKGIPRHIGWDFRSFRDYPPLKRLLEPQG